ncbi:hypothetical protein K474DRAFT_1091970 [Panus rudis PR-1116 ss-1]|nr:hypothetical protein K474DRAFT_1091970 [Panus rudis PR-1116 ss-1]
MANPQPWQQFLDEINATVQIATPVRRSARLGRGRARRRGPTLRPNAPRTSNAAGPASTEANVPSGSGSGSGTPSPAASRRRKGQLTPKRRKTESTPGEADGTDDDAGNAKVTPSPRRPGRRRKSLPELPLDICFEVSCTP